MRSGFHRALALVLFLSATICSGANDSRLAHAIVDLESIAKAISSATQTPINQSNVVNSTSALIFYIGEAKTQQALNGFMEKLTESSLCDQCFPAFAGLFSKSLRRRAQRLLEDTFIGKNSGKNETFKRNGWLSTTVEEQRYDFISNVYVQTVEMARAISPQDLSWTNRLIETAAKNLSLLNINHSILEKVLLTNYSPNGRDYTLRTSLINRYFQIRHGTRAPEVISKRVLERVETYWSWNTRFLLALPISYDLGVTKEFKRLLTFMRRRYSKRILVTREH